MPRIPEIELNDISIAPEYIGRHGYSLCVDGLWGIYNVIKKITDDVEKKLSDPATKALECLYMIGLNAGFENENMNSLIYTGKTNKKYKRNMPAAKYLFALEKYGFAFYDLITTKKDTPRNKLAIKDIAQFGFSYNATDFNGVILGLKLFVTACDKITGDPFYASDIKIMYGDTSKLYAPPVSEVFYQLTDEQKAVMTKIHERLESLGCERNLEREYMMRYFHPKAKSKTFATLYVADVLQYWNSSGDESPSISIKLNLRHIGRYIHYLIECTEAIQRSIIETENCGGCKKGCGGVSFEFDGVSYNKCPWHIFRFNDFSKKALDNYIKLIELESRELNLKK